MEYKTLNNYTAELICVEALVRELGISLTTKPCLRCDNLGGTYLYANPVFHARTKHVEINLYFVRERVANKLVEIKFISRKDEVLDDFTKTLPVKKLNDFKCNLKFSRGFA